MIDVPIYHHPDYPVRRAYDGDAGLDLPTVHTEYFSIGHFFKVFTGVHVAIPEGYEGQLRMRSSAGLKGIFICNAPGTIDSGYRGEIVAHVRWAPGCSGLPCPAGAYILQLVICPVPRVNLVSVESPEDLPPSERGAKGFGSSGK